MFSLEMDLVLDILLPRTDAGVVLQLLAIVVVLVISLWRFWSITELRLVVLGLGLVILGLLGIRALH